MKNSLLLKNCKLYNSDKNLVDIFIEGSIISNIGKSNNLLPKGWIPKGVETIDIKGNIIAPGLIDVHIQGAGGADVLDSSIEALETISKTLARIGTTSYLGTTVVKPSNNNEHLKLAREYVEKDLGGANLLGFHLEGPFINIKKKGGLAEDGIYPSTPEALEEVFEVTDGKLKMMTIAPELPGNLNIIKRLVENNVVASFAHSDATYEETKKGFDAGINHVTHIFNAMPVFHHRNPGPLGAIFDNNYITAQIISDGHHLHSSIVKMVYKIIGGSRCICITDGLQGIGLPEGKYFYNGKEYISKDGAAKYLDGTLIGSTMSLWNIILKFKEFTGCSLAVAIDSVTKIPAKLLGIDNKKGSIETGKDADLIIFNDQYKLLMTLVNGKVVYNQSN